MHNEHDILRAVASLQATGIDCIAGESMARHTTYRVGGPAALMATPSTDAALCETLEVLAAFGVPAMVIGGGSNLLVSDEGFNGALVRLGEGFRTIEVDGTRIRAGGALGLAQAVGTARDHGLTGLEFATGIPGSVGGAIAMNAGSRNEWIGPVVRSVTYVPVAPASGDQHKVATVTVAGDSVQWSYRSTDLRDRAVITEVILELSLGDRSAIVADMAEATKRRRESQPLGLPNAGSVFKNPPGDSAGRLIEECGLKGYTIGGAEISQVHANFIVAHEGALAADVYKLVQHVRGEVVDRFGVELTPEIRILGRF